MNVYISGSSGLIGSALRENLESDGHRVTALPRTYEKAIDFSGVNVVVHLAGESIAEGRWSAAKKQRIMQSRVGRTKQLCMQLASNPRKPSLFISASAIGFYGDRNSEVLDENSQIGEGFLSEVCSKWEEASLPAAKTGIRTVNLRTGMVLSTKGGALNKMLPPFRFGGGGMLGSGEQYMSWISLDDTVKSIRFIMENQSLAGPVNLVSPNPVTNLEFTKTLGKVLKRPTIMPLPAFAARLLFGEMADALLLSSARVIPKKLVEANYKFKHDTLQSALEDILK